MLATACGALFLVGVDNLVLNVALPQIAAQLNATTSELQWIVAAYFVTFASMQIFGGAIGDRFGRRLWLLLGLSIFVAASAIGASANNVGVVILGRALQGVGAAIIMPLTLSLLSAAYTGEARLRALGIWMAVSFCGLAAGPLVGGLLVQFGSWHWGFLFNIPIGVALIGLTAAVVAESRGDDAPLDLVGTALITVAIASLAAMIILLGEIEGAAWQVWTLAVMAIGAAGGFAFWQARAATPMLPPQFFRSPGFLAANLDALALGIIMGAFALYFTLYLQNVLGLTPVLSGLAFLPWIGAMIFGSLFLAPRVARNMQRAMFQGFTVLAIGQVALLGLVAARSYPLLVPALLMMGIGTSLLFAPITAAAIEGVDAARTGLASAVNGTAREVGAVLGSAIAGAHINIVYRGQLLKSGLSSNDPVVQSIGLAGYGGTAALRQETTAAFLSGLSQAVLLCLIVAISIAAGSFLLRRRQAST